MDFEQFTVIPNGVINILYIVYHFLWNDFKTMTQ